MQTRRSGEGFAKWAAALLAVGLPALAFVGSGPGLTPSTFVADDGNQATEASGANAGPDWQNPPSNFQSKQEEFIGQQDNSFVEGTKEDTEVPTIETGSIPGNKDDLDRFGVASETVSGKQFMYLFWTRHNTNGTANLDFEFNQSSEMSSNGQTPKRTAGDLLFTFDFDAGGKNPEKVFLSYSRWVTGPATANCEANGAKPPCWGPLAALATSFAEGAVNKEPIADYVADPSGNTTLEAHTFGEAAINLTDSGIIPPGTCNPFASAYVKSRSSTSISAALKDFIKPVSLNFQTCGTINIHKQDDVGTALTGAEFTLYNGDVNVSDSKTCDGSSTGKTCTTDASGNCSMSSVPFGDYCVAETKTPAGHFTANAQEADLSSGTATVNLTFVDRRKLTLKVIKQDDLGAALQNAGFTLFASDGTTVVKPECKTPANGICLFTELNFGSYVLKETTVPDGYLAGIPAAGHAFTLDTNSPQTTELTFQNPRTFRIITFVCRESDKTLWPSTASLDGGAAIPTLATPPIGLSESGLCNIPAATFTGKLPGGYPMNVTIPVTQ